MGQYSKEKITHIDGEARLGVRGREYNITIEYKGKASKESKLYSGLAQQHTPMAWGVPAPPRFHRLLYPIYSMT